VAPVIDNPLFFVPLCTRQLSNGVFFLTNANRPALNTCTVTKGNYQAVLFGFPFLDDANIIQR